MRIDQQQVFLNDLVREAVSGRLGVADFQRPYAWNGEQVEALMSSILRGWPIGSFVVWDPSEDMDMSAVSRGRLGPVGSNEECRTLLLDGQNRLASFAWAFADTGNFPGAMTFSGREKDVWLSGNTLVADFDDRRVKFVPSSEERGRHRVPFGELIRATHRATGSGKGFLPIASRIMDAGADEAAIDWFFDELPGRIRSARTVVTTLQGATVEEAKEAFLHICRVGQPISEDDFDAAVNWSSGIGKRA